MDHTDVGLVIPQHGISLSTYALNTLLLLLVITAAQDSKNCPRQRLIQVSFRPRVRVKLSVTANDSNNSNQQLLQLPRVSIGVLSTGFQTSWFRGDIDRRQSFSSANLHIPPSSSH